MLYDEYSSEDFLNFVQSKLNPEFVKLETAQLENIQKRDAIEVYRLDFIYKSCSDSLQLQVV